MKYKVDSQGNYKFTGLVDEATILSVAEKIREARFPFWTCDTSRATAELGFTAPTGIGAGLADTLAWYKEAGWLTY